MTVVVGARNLFKADAGVVHALLQARYYDGSKGQFLSEDPVFLGDPKQQVLADPQIGLEKIAQQLEEEGVLAKTVKKRHARRYAPNFCTG